MVTLLILYLFILNDHCSSCRAAEAEQYQQDMLACANPVSDSLVAEIINEETASIACDVYQSDVVEKQIHLDNARKATELLMCARWFRVWCDQYGGRQRLRRYVLANLLLKLIQPKKVFIFAKLMLQSA